MFGVGSLLVVVITGQTKALFPLVPTIDSTRIQLDSFSILFEYCLMHIGLL